MFKINGTTIHITRGDIATIGISAKNSDGTDYIFKVGDVVRLNVFKKKDCNFVVLKKDVTVETEGQTKIEISLTSTDTRIGELINRPVEYWYEVELNPKTSPQTIIGYDDMGGKIFTLYPEGDNSE